MGFEFETVSLISPSSLADPPFEELAPRLGILAGTYKLRLKTNPSRSGQFVFAVVVTAPAPREGVTMRVGKSLVSVVKVK